MATEIDSDPDLGLIGDRRFLENARQLKSVDAASNQLSDGTKRTVRLYVKVHMIRWLISQVVLGKSKLQKMVMLLILALELTPDRFQIMCELVQTIDPTSMSGDTDEKRQNEYNQMVSFLDLMVVLQQSVEREWSRYHREFAEVAFLADGGFGKVFLARNKLDGAMYAVKKVPFRLNNIPNVLVHLAEVKTSASLNHINIVPYKAAWLEPLLSPGKSSNNTNGSSAMDVGDEEDNDVDQQSELANLLGRMKLESSNSLRRPEHDSEESGDPAVSAGDENRSQVVELEDLSRDVISTKDAQQHLNNQLATLYIKMAPCGITLRHFLDKRNASENFDQFYVKYQLQNHADVVLDVFQQLVNGVHYMHYHGYVHHDIKPSNIFVTRSHHDSAITIKLGDFGLSCHGSSHAGVGGTPLYAAPEQLEGKCDPKSDIYTLGIVLLELLVPFSTDMIKQVCRGQYPADLDRDFTALLKNLLQQRPSRRPGMLELVEAVNQIRINRDKVVAELRQSLSLRDDEIVSLRTQIDEQQRVQLESDEERLMLERRTSRTLVVKEQELIYMSF